MKNSTEAKPRKVVILVCVALMAATITVAVVPLVWHRQKPDPTPVITQAAVVPAEAPIEQSIPIAETPAQPVVTASVDTNTVAEAISVDVDPAKEQRDAMLLAMGYGTNGGHGFKIDEKSRKTQ